MAHPVPRPGTTLPTRWRLTLLVLGALLIAAGVAIGAAVLVGVLGIF